MTSAHRLRKLCCSVCQELSDNGVIRVLVTPLPFRQEGELLKLIQWLQLQFEGQVGGRYGSWFGCGYGCDDKWVFPPDCHLAVDVLEKIDSLPSFPGKTSGNGEATVNVENGVVVSASCGRML